jgi:hypothetical protein
MYTCARLYITYHRLTPIDTYRYRYVRTSIRFGGQEHGKVLSGHELLKYSALLLGGKNDECDD